MGTYIDMNTDLRKKAKSDFGKTFFKFFNNAGFGKTMKIVRKDRDIKPVTIENRGNYLVSEPKYQTTKILFENLLANRNEKTQKPKNKPVYLGSPILELSKIVMYEF